MILGTSCIVTVQKETRVLDSGLFFVILTLISLSFRFVKKIRTRKRRNENPVFFFALVRNSGAFCLSYYPLLL